jgi:hypothetical protein
MYASWIMLRMQETWRLVETITENFGPQSHSKEGSTHSIYQYKVVFLDVTQINLVNRYQSFRDTCYPHLQG